MVSYIEGVIYLKNKKLLRSEETKQAILIEASKLFAKKGFDAVSIREIAKEAQCSHTTIYLYFKDKETLLHELSMPTLKKLYNHMSEITASRSYTAELKLKKLSLFFINFCLKNKSMYTIFINAKSSRVDELDPDLEINKLRIQLFSLIKETLGQYLKMENKEKLLDFSRIFFYNLYGVLSTYSYQHEPTEVLMKRLTPILDLSIEVLLSGFKTSLKEGNKQNENQTNF